MEFAAVAIVDMIHKNLGRQMSRVTDLKQKGDHIEFNFGCRRYGVTTRAEVYEIVEGMVVPTAHAGYVAHLLNGGKRDDAGNYLPAK